MKYSPQSPVLLCGYGNFDREDDGVAWHVLSRCAARLHYPFPGSPVEFEFAPGQPVDFLFTLQLVPELSETVAQYARVCFIDAHTGAVPEELHLEAIAPGSQNSPFTHHLTPPTLLDLTSRLYHRKPEALLVSVRGYFFGFSQQLSEPTDHLADRAVEAILMWLEKS